MPSAYYNMYIGLAGASPIENAELFSLVECVEDLWLRISAFFWEKDEARKVLEGVTLSPRQNYIA